MFAKVINGLQNLPLADEEFSKLYISNDHFKTFTKDNFLSIRTLFFLSTFKIHYRNSFLNSVLNSMGIITWDDGVMIAMAKLANQICHQVPVV